MNTKKAKPKKKKEEKRNRVVRISIELDNWLCMKAREKFGSSEPQDYIRAILWDLFQADKQVSA